MIRVLIASLLFTKIILADATSSLCLTGSTPFQLATYCSPGYYCPLYNSSDANTFPVQCAATNVCLIDRLKTLFCSAQGTYEPVPCQDGYYCPTPMEKIVCPVNHICPIGQYEPIQCGPMTTCPAGSSKKFEYSSIIILLAVNIACIIMLFAAFQWREHQRKLRDEKYSVLSTALNSHSHYDSIPDLEKDTTLTNEMPSQSIASEMLCQSFQRARGTLPLLHLTFDKLCLSIPIKPSSKDSTTATTPTTISKKQMLPILKSVTGSLTPGKVTAIMGPSGAGKTTLLNTMLGNIESDWERGGILQINGIIQEELSRFRKITGYVPQEDIMHRDLTVYENIRYSASIRLPSTWTETEREDHVHAILHALQLYPVRDRMIGDELRRGISGGQRKRVNIGIELAAAPQLLLLDEPTSGLDATAAMDICTVLKELAESSQITVAMVIHQPRIEIWHQLDELLLLAPGGLTVYQGPQQQAMDYFTTYCQVTWAVHENPSDFLMDAIGRHGEEYVLIWKEHVQESQQQLQSQREIVPYPILSEDPRKVHVAPQQQVGESNLSSIEMVESGGGVMMMPWAPFPTNTELRILPNFFTQTILALERNLWKQGANLSTLGLEIGLAIFGGGVMGTLSTVRYQGILSAPYTLLSPTPLEGLIASFFYNVGLCVSLAASSAGVSVFGEEQVIYRREIASGHNHAAYYTGVVIAQYPRLLLDSVHFATLFHIQSQPLTTFTNFFAAVFFIYVAIYGIAFIMNMLVQRKNAALLSVVVSLFVSAMTRKGGIPEVIQYLSPSRWGTELIFHYETAPFIHIMEVENVSAKAGGYVRGRVALDFLCMFLTGVLYRVIAYILMRYVDRKIIR